MRRAGLRATFIFEHAKKTSEIKTRKIQHVKCFARELVMHFKKRALHNLDPSRYYSVFVDGADQSAFGVPNGFEKKRKRQRLFIAALAARVTGSW